MQLNNEFALVHLEVDKTANGERLKITSVRTGRSRSFDPLMLEVLTWLPTDHFLAALETPFGPEPDLAVGTDLDQAADVIYKRGANGAAEARVR